MNGVRYPARTKWLHRAVAEMGEGEVAIRGRILQVDRDGGVLADASGEGRFYGSKGMGRYSEGDIVEISGCAANGILQASSIRVLAAGGAEWRAGDWLRFNRSNALLRERMELRAAVVEAVRRYFGEEGFLAVETPALIRATAQEEHIQLFATESSAPGVEGRYYLAPSPELHMKRLLVAGFEKIYQLSRAYRDGEVGPLHNPEFTLIEWYRAYASYEEIMGDVEKLVAYVAEAVRGRVSICRRGDEIPLAPPWPRVEVGKAFKRWGQVDLNQCQEVEALYRRAVEVGFASANPNDSWDDLFHKILVEKIEPELAAMGAVHLIDYPRPLAALAKLKEGDSGYAERAEAYVGGVELSNGYTELNDPEEQLRRFAAAADGGADSPPMDREFLNELARGMPPAGGVALGLDRLVMLVAGADRLAEVIAFPQGF